MSSSKLALEGKSEAVKGEVKGEDGSKDGSEDEGAKKEEIGEKDVYGKEKEEEEDTEDARDKKGNQGGEIQKEVKGEVRGAERERKIKKRKR